MRLLAVNGTNKNRAFQPYLKNKTKDEYKITFTANYFPLSGSLMYAQNFPKDTLRYEITYDYLYK
jgi:hypothetical protein